MYVVKAPLRLLSRSCSGATMPATVSKQQARTDATRKRLLAAAERIFARDGFEAARLEDIASLAGYTRGAFYANFEDKEDIFFALLEQYVAERIGEVNALLQRYKDPEDRLQALRSHYARIAEDRRLALLSLEFKLFAIRHPEAHARLRARQQSMRACGGGFLRRIAKDLGRTLRFPADASVTGLGALSNALFLEHIFDPKTMPGNEMRHLLGAFFDAVIGPPARNQRN
jgi:AcrR family transcriptional regulator